MEQQDREFHEWELFGNKYHHIKDEVMKATTVQF